MWGQDWKKKHESAQAKIHHALAQGGTIGRAEVEADPLITSKMQLGDVWESKFSLSGKDRISNYTLIMN